ncbi:MAG TPA: N-acetyltransferase, partial [Algoriphagus sp.]|nr:N-acetyltransferase [Algoriphagus sp.]
MSFLIRPYQSQDCKAILEIINDSILNTFFNYDYHVKTHEEVSRNFDQKLNDNIPILVGEMNGKVVGYAT